MHPHLDPLNPSEGHHTSLFSRALRLAWNEVPPEQAFYILSDWWTQSALRPLKPRELESQIANAYREVGRQRPSGRRFKGLPKGFPSPPPRILTPTQDDVLKAEILQSLPPELVFRWGAELFHQGKDAAVRFLRTIFSPDDLVCAGGALSSMQTLCWSDWLALWGDSDTIPQFIVPNPMRACEGVTKEGNRSSRCKSNACLPAQRRVSVVEFDNGSLEEQARLLLVLATTCPLVAVVFSGRRSLHGWFRHDLPRSIPPANFWAQALVLGADKAMLRTEQPARLPGGTRVQEGQRITQSLLWVAGSMTERRSK